MPTLINLRLRALRNCELGPSHGEYTHAAFLGLVGSIDSALAATLHDSRGSKPFVVGLVGDWGADGRHHIQAGQIVSWHVSLLRDDVALAACRALACLPIDERGHLQIGTGMFVVESSSNRPQDGGDTASFADLLEGGARAAKSTVDLAVVSPLAFSLGEQEFGRRIELFPLPELVFGSLLRRWRQYAPADYALPADLLDWIKGRVIVARYSLRTVGISSSKGPQLGCVGSVGYRAMAEEESAELAHWQALAEFARFSAIGSRTTMGWGQVRRLPGAPEAPRKQRPIGRGRGSAGMGQTRRLPVTVRGTTDSPDE